MGYLCQLNLRVEEKEYKDFLGSHLDMGYGDFEIQTEEVGLSREDMSA